jgi:hypothetical protein
MDILSPNTLTLLKDEKLQKAIEEILKQGTNEAKTVELTKNAGEAGPATQVRVRRVA